MTLATAKMLYEHYLANWMKDAAADMKKKLLARGFDPSPKKSKK